MRNLRLLVLFGLASGFISEKVFVSSQTTFPVIDDLYLEGQTSGELSIDDEDGEDDDDGGSGSGDYAHSNVAVTEEGLKKLLNFSQTTVSWELVPSRPQPSAAAPLSPSTKAPVSQNPATKVSDAVMPPFVLPNGGNRNEVSQSTSSATIPPGDTSPTKFGITVVDHADNSLDTWNVSPTKNRGDEIQIKRVENEIFAENGRNGRMFEVDTPEEVTSENTWERTDVLAAVIACGVVGFLCAVFLLLLLAYRMKKKDEGSYELGDTKVSTTAYQKAPTKEFYA
uniref:Syndecan n=1 Tax=Gasterosteus aculeatus aculeatus TaxID=481459 RepID=A0AAQ4P6H8_GASAC|nr:syndecan-2-B-like isoform X1 [Gasterosteus aculeatus aculeatus]